MREFKNKEVSNDVYTQEQIKDAEAFVAQLKKLPMDSITVVRLLTIGFMNGLDAARLCRRTYSRTEKERGEVND